MTVTRSGSTRKYAENWSKAFGGGKKKVAKTTAKSAKSTPKKAKAAKKKAAGRRK